MRRMVSLSPGVPVQPNGAALLRGSAVDNGNALRAAFEREKAFTVREAKRAPNTRRLTITSSRARRAEPLRFVIKIARGTGYSELRVFSKVDYTTAQRDLVVFWILVGFATFIAAPLGMFFGLLLPVAAVVFVVRTHRNARRAHEFVTASVVAVIVTSVGDRVVASKEEAAAELGGLSIEEDADSAKGGVSNAYEVGAVSPLN